MEKINQKLHQEFVQLGRERNRLTYKLLNLLPEIYEKGIYREHGCATIEEYAGKYAGLSKFVVKKRLRLEKNLKDKPKLKEIIAKEGIHKVAIIAKIATPETDQFWANKVKNMSKDTLFKVGKEIRSKTEVSEICRAADEKLNLELTGEALFLFLKLKKKFAANVNNNEAAKVLLQKLNEIMKPEEQAKKTTKSCPGATFYRSSGKTVVAKKSSRHISAAQKREILAQTDGKCAYPNCNKPYEILHHRDRFMNSKNHDSVIPLCKEHHEFMHNSFIADETSAPAAWQLKIDKDMRDRSEQRADLLYQKYRQEALL